VPSSFSWLNVNVEQKQPEAAELLSQS
jgi:hypothetical protein